MTILCKVAHLIAALAFDTLGRAGIGTVGGLMLGGSAVTTGKPVDARFSAVTGTMSTGVTVDTFDLDPVHQSPLLLATTSSVTHFTAITALGDLSIVREASDLKALKVLFRVGRPAFLEVRALRLRAEVECNDILAVQLALEIDQADAVFDWFLHGNKVNVEILLAHFLLNINKCGLRNRLGIDLEALTEVFQISLVASLLEGSPSFLGKLVRDIVQIEFAILGALDSLVTFGLAVLAHIRGSIRALRSRVSFLAADTARTLEHARLGALCLGMTLLATIEASHTLTRCRTFTRKMTITSTIATFIVIALFASAEGGLELTTNLITAPFALSEVSSRGGADWVDILVSKIGAIVVIPAA